MTHPVRCRPRPIEVEAMQYMAETCVELHRWLGCEHSVEATDRCGLDYLTFPSADGDVTVEPGDWVVRGLFGALAAWKPDAFAAEFEPIP